MSKQNRQSTFLNHLEELRNRIIKCLIFFVAVSCLFYQYVESILQFLIKPVGQLYFLSPSEAFEARIVLTIFGGFILSSPFIFFQLWQFLSAALTSQEKRFVTIFAPFSMVLFLLGCAFAYFVALPFSITFLLSFSTEFIKPMITVSRYIHFAGTLVLAFGFIFEFPLVMLFFIKMGIATPEFLIQQRRYAIVFIFIISAILTPPDCVSQLLMALPLLFLYELSIVMAKWHVQSEAKKARWSVGL